MFVKLGVRTNSKYETLESPDEHKQLQVFIINPITAIQSAVS